MSKTINEIHKAAKDRHDDLSAQYYKDPEHYPGGKIQFDLEHARIWSDMQVELIDNGYEDEVFP